MILPSFKSKCENMAEICILKPWSSNSKQSNFKVFVIMPKPRFSNKSSHSRLYLWWHLLWWFQSQVCGAISLHQWFPTTLPTSKNSVMPSSQRPAQHTAYCALTACSFSLAPLQERFTSKWCVWWKIEAGNHNKNKLLKLLQTFHLTAWNF